MEYSFNIAGESEEARHIYYMNSEDFKCARYDSKHHLMMLIGKAKQENYDDYANKKMNKELPIWEMPEGSAYGIFMGYTNEEELTDEEFEIYSKARKNMIILQGIVPFIVAIVAFIISCFMLKKSVMQLICI